MIYAVSYDWSMGHSHRKVKFYITVIIVITFFLGNQYCKYYYDYFYDHNNSYCGYDNYNRYNDNYIYKDDISDNNNDNNNNSNDNNDNIITTYIFIDSLCTNLVLFFLNTLLAG